MDTGESIADRSERAARVRPVVPIAAVAGAVVWLLVGLAGAGLSWSAGTSRYSSVIDLVLPPTAPPVVWAQVAPWNVVQPVLVAVLFGALLGLGLALVAGRPGWATSSRLLRIGAAWLVAVFAADLTALLWTVGTAVVDPGPNGYMWVLRDAIPTAVATGWFGTVWGWVPAVIVGGAPRLPAGSTSRTRAGRRTAAVAGATALVLAVVLIAVQPTIARDARVAAGGTPDGLPTETVTPTPRPAAPAPVAADPVTPGAGWCSAEDVQLSLSGVDGALGHRAMSVVLVNRSSSACIVDGFPDVAFAADDGATVAVPLEHGASYMGGAATPAPVTVAPGATAVAALAWGAGGTGEAVSTFWLAPYAGASRTPLTADTDLAADATVTVSAWAAPTTGSD
ncbi:DUF4232 domain-containing protein [Curtobacterium sp. ZW137]|uniref:DUF4232 domain-containing protein n=1 Tax=Curtobacterium sp. ZW137 TaxID=2485104 RepID=UPI000F4C9ADF|nr:DUF4232 domain-containing protein [Curtobacterium sp. ZW137]ROP65901.1 uncharacterized protein DUF4232 [Curtobacterium sp. ZW137]